VCTRHKSILFSYCQKKVNLPICLFVESYFCTPYIVHHRALCDDIISKRCRNVCFHCNISTVVYNYVILIIVHSWRMTFIFSYVYFSKDFYTVAVDLKYKFWVKIVWWLSRRISLSQLPVSAVWCLVADVSFTKHSFIRNFRSWRCNWCLMIPVCLL